MAAWGIVIDSTFEDATNTPLDLNDGTNFRALAPIGLDPPAPDPLRAETNSTEGETPIDNFYNNRIVAFPVRVYGASAAAFETNLRSLHKKVAKINREASSASRRIGGTLRLTTSAPSNAFIFDLVAASVVEIFDSSYGANFRTEASLSFEARPFARGAAVQEGDHIETTLPVLVAIDADIGGDVPALGKLLIDEDEAVSQWWVTWGVESLEFDTTDPTNKKLFYQAESLTALGLSATAVGASGASGAGSNVVRNTDLNTGYQGVVSTQLTGGGAHQGHVGIFRVYARLYRPTGNTGAIDVALEWSEGDFRNWKRNAAVSYEADEREGSFTLADLGLVYLTRATARTQRWEGRIVARSSIAGDELDVDCLFLVPAERSGIFKALGRQPSVSTFSARDSFNQAGTPVLTGQVAATGGTWTVAPTEAGPAADADDFVVGTPITSVANRSAVSDASLQAGRVVTIGTTTYAGIIAGVRFANAVLPPADSIRQGIVVRLADMANYLALVQRTVSGSQKLRVSLIERIAGVETVLFDHAENLSSYFIGGTKLEVIVDANGAWVVKRALALYMEPVTIGAGQRTSLATSGTLASGRLGILDAYTSATALVRYCDEFYAYATQTDAALFASQSAEVRYDGVLREDSGGTLWQKPSDASGDLLLVAPEGLESRQHRWIVKASRGDPDIGFDSGVDNISARLTWIPRYLNIPE